MRRDVFQAIADPNRRAILDMLAGNRLNINEVADKFEISRPAVSKHIKILEECGLVDIIEQGRERFCEVRLERLNEVAEWIERYRQFWETKLDDLEIYLKELQEKEKKND